VSVVYGRNGSGKTTIANAMKAYVLDKIGVDGDDTPKEYTVTADAPIPEEECKQVFVFDEDFVSKQVKVSREGINTIVMLGEQVELDEQIARKKADFAKVDKEWHDLKALQDQYEDASVTFSPLYYFNKIRDGLREEGGWADIDRDLKGNTLKSRVTGDVVYGLLGLEEPKATYEVLRKQLMADLKLYLESENAEMISWKAEAIGKPGNLYIIKKMLKRPLDSPKLSSREQRLMNMVAMSSHYAWHFSQQNTRQMLDDGWTFCPLCLREIKEQDKTDITETLTHILNKEADEYEEKLTRQLEDFAPVEVEMPEFPGNLKCVRGQVPDTGKRC
jgi:energy-coupling factor transporter ATP-binding protein EcfA2